MKVGFALSGGGALGAWQVGALKAIHDAGIKPSCAVGTSVGAINAAALSYNDLGTMEMLWRGLRKTSDVQKSRWWKLLWMTGLNTFDPLKGILEKELGPEPKFPTFAAYTNLKNGQLMFADLESHNREDAIKFILASSSVALFHEPIDLPNGDYGVDGGHRAVLPLEFLLKSEKVDKIVVVGTHPLPIHDGVQPWEPSFPKLLSIGGRALEVMVEEIYQNDFNRCDARDMAIFTPPEFLQYDAMEYNPASIRALITRGYEDASRTIWQYEDSGFGWW